MIKGNFNRLIPLNNEYENLTLYIMLSLCDLIIYKDSVIQSIKNYIIDDSASCRRTSFPTSEGVDWAVLRSQSINGAVLRCRKLMLYSYNNSWMGLYILIFQIFMIVLYGIFARTGSLLTSFTTLETPLYFTLAYTLLSLRQRMCDWMQLTNYLFIVAICFQMNTLYLMFWDAAFNTGFFSTTAINSYYLIVNIECILAVLVTSFQFTGKLSLQQLFALSLIEVFAFALNFSICQFGIRAITGGCTVNVFLFGYLFAAPIRKLVCTDENDDPVDQRERYFTLVLKLLGLVVAIILWPNFSYSTAQVDEYYLITSYSSLLSTAALSAQAFLHTFLGFCSAIGTAIGLRILGEKIALDKFVNTLLLTGVFLGSSSTVIIDPFASLLMGVFAPLLLYLLQKFLPFILLKGYSIDAIIICVLGGIFDSIFAAGRSSRTPALTNNPYQQGGLQFAAVLVTACFAFLLGLLAAAVLRCFNPRESNLKDGTLWFIDQETLPIYRDDPLLQKIMDRNHQKDLKQQNVLFNLKQSYISEKERQNHDLGRILKQKLQAESGIR